MFAVSQSILLIVVEREKVMQIRSSSTFSRFAISALACCPLFAGVAVAQSTATVVGTVSDATGASVPNATVTVRNQNTGEERSTATDASGSYVVPSLAVGTYRVEVKSPGMQTVVASNLVLEVGSTIRQDFALKVASTSETVEITAAAPVINESPVSVGTVVNQPAVQEVPLDGRHFVDLALLIPGSVPPPSNGFLTPPLPGQGSVAFTSA